MKLGTMTALAFPLLALLSSPAERVYVESPSTWFEEVASRARIAPDGRSAIYGSRGRVKVIDLATGREDASARTGLDAVLDAQFLPGGGIALRGRRGDEQGLFLPEQGRLRLSPLPPDAAPHWSRDGGAVAFYRRGEPEAGLFLGDAANPRPHLPHQRVTGLAWAPDGQSVYAVVVEDTGASSIVQISRGKGEAAVMARDLDAPPRESPLAVSADGRRLYIALASPGRPDNEARHRPSVDRDLDIYEIAVDGGTPRRVVERPDDDFAPNMVGNHLYWTRAEVRESVVVFPAAGGPVKEVVPDAEGPTWRGDGRQIGFTFGSWRIADWALNLDGGVVDFDPDKKCSFPWIVTLDPQTGRPGVLTKLPLPSGVSGAEWASWSPRGDEIALEVEAGPGRHAIWVVKADGSAGEKRIEYDMQTYGGVDWAPDGKSIVYAALAEGRMQILSVGARGTRLRVLARDSSHLFQPQFSPDGQLIACTRLRQLKEIWRVSLQ